MSTTPRGPRRVARRAEAQPGPVPRLARDERAADIARGDGGLSLTGALVAVAHHLEETPRRLCLLVGSTQVAHEGLGSLGHRVGARTGQAPTHGSLYRRRVTTSRHRGRVCAGTLRRPAVWPTGALQPAQEVREHRRRERPERLGRLRHHGGHTGRSALAHGMERTGHTYLPGSHRLVLWTVYAGGLTYTQGGCRRTARRDGSTRP